MKGRQTDISIRWFIRDCKFFNSIFNR